jgi:hypothetical protein
MAYYPLYILVKAIFNVKSEFEYKLLRFPLITVQIIDFSLISSYFFEISTTYAPAQN